MDSAIKCLLKRYSQGNLEEFPESLVTPVIAPVLQQIDEIKGSCNKGNVYLAARRRFPDFLECLDEEEISNEELITIGKLSQVKNGLIDLSNEVQKAAIFKNDDPSFDWEKLANKHLDSLVGQNSKVERSFKARALRGKSKSSVVCSWGYPIWDAYLNGGVTVGYHIWYGGSNLGKSTTGTSNFIYQFIKQGKKVLVYYLEHSPEKFVDKTLSQWCGFFDKDCKDYTDEDYAALDSLDESADFDIVLYNASDYRNLQSDVVRHKPDIVIFDQLTITDNSKDREVMERASSNLKRLSREYGLPVIAITQSDLDNYFGTDNKKRNKHADEDAHGEVGRLKYAQAIFQDAATVLELRKYPSRLKEHANKRLVSVRKLKDDSAIREGDLTFIIELFSDGVKCIGRRDSNGAEIPLSLIKIPERGSNKSIEKIELKTIEEPLPEPSRVLSPSSVKFEQGSSSDSFEFIPNNLFSQDILDKLPDRLSEIADHSEDKELWGDLVQAAHTNQLQYGDVHDPNYLNSFEHFTDFGSSFRRFYY